MDLDPYMARRGSSLLAALAFASPCTSASCASSDPRGPVSIAAAVSEGSDLELVQAWRGGDAKAGRELFERHFDALYRFFVGKVGDAADDLVQQTLTACVRAREGYRGEASFRAYLFAIARHELYHHLARGLRGGPRQDIGELSLQDLGTSPSAGLARKDDERLLLEGLRRLPLDQQIVVELYYFECLRGRDLVAALDIPEGTVRSRLRLALERLRRELESMSVAGDPLSSTLTTIADWANGLREGAEE
jgi:RNA polymerase sigma-70 factor (ECF subfamily)